MSMKLDELKNVNLKGYCYFVAAWGMSSTSRHSYDPEQWIVLEDSGMECIVAPIKSQSWTKTYRKETVAGFIANYPALGEWNEELKSYENKVVKL